MNYMGFIIDNFPGNSLGNVDAANKNTTEIETQEQQSTQSSVFLQYRLHWPTSTYDLESFNMILRMIDDDSVPLQHRIQISKEVVLWQEKDHCNEEVKSAAFIKYYFKILEFIRFTMIESDELLGNNIALNSIQLPALNLAKALQRECEINNQLAVKVALELNNLIKFVVERRMSLHDQQINSNNSNSDNNVNTNQQHGEMSLKSIKSNKSNANHAFAFVNYSAIYRAETMKTLLLCVPKEGLHGAEIKELLDVLMELTSVSQSDSLRAQCAQVVQTLFDQSDDAGRLSESLTPHVEKLLASLAQGNKSAVALLRRCKQFFDAQSDQLLEHFSELLEHADFEEVKEVLEQLAERDVRKLFKSADALVRQLARVAEEHKLLILGVLLSIALVSATVLAPFLGPIVAGCLAHPAIYVPLFKVLSVVGANCSGEIALTALQLLARVAKSGLIGRLDRFTQSMLLEAINVVKDKVQYANLLHPETMRALENISASNERVFRNIALWNAGKKAKVGDARSYALMTAPANSGQPQTPAKSSSSAVSSASSTPASSNIDGQRRGIFGFSLRSTGKKRPAVAPSLQSQNIAIVTELHKQQQLQVQLQGKLQESNAAETKEEVHEEVREELTPTNKTTESHILPLPQQLSVGQLPPSTPAHENNFNYYNHLREPSVAGAGSLKDLSGIQRRDLFDQPAQSAGAGQVGRVETFSEFIARQNAAKNLSSTSTSTLNTPFNTPAVNNAHMHAISSNKQNHNFNIQTNSDAITRSSFNFNNNFNNPSNSKSIADILAPIDYQQRLPALADPWQQSSKLPETRSIESTRTPMHAHFNQEVRPEVKVESKEMQDKEMGKEVPGSGFAAQQSTGKHSIVAGEVPVNKSASKWALSNLLGFSRTKRNQVLDEVVQSNTS